MILIVLIFCTTPFSANRVEILREDGASVVHLIGDVVIEDEKRKITCDEAYMYETEDYVNLLGNVVISDSNGTIYSSSARFVFENQRGYLGGNVILERKDETISADSLYYDGSKSRVEMFNNVRIDDRKNDMIVNGDHGSYNLESEEGALYGDPQLLLMREEKDPINIQAQVFKLNIRQNEFYGYDSVVANIDSIIVLCDTFQYDLKNERGMLIHPEITEKDNFLKGDSGYFSMENKEIKNFVVQNGWSRYFDREGSKNIVQGNTIGIEFEKGQARLIRVEGDPRGVLYLKAEGNKDNAGNERSD